MYWTQLWDIKHQLQLIIQTLQTTKMLICLFLHLDFQIWPNIRSKVTYYRVQFNSNLGGICVVYILAVKGDIEVNMNMVNFTHNQYLGGCIIYFTYGWQ